MQDFTPNIDSWILLREGSPPVAGMPTESGKSMARLHQQVREFFGARLHRG